MDKVISGEILKKDIIIHPRKGKNEQSIPEKGLLLVNPTEAYPRIKKELAAAAESRFLFNAKLCVHKDPSYFLAGPAIGAPMAAMTLEKLIVLGAGQIILCGWCGAVERSYKVGDIVVPTSAVAGEGTSQYYLGDSQPAPSQDLSDRVGELFTSHEMEVKGGCVWSTDAVYRESRSRLAELATDQQVVAVDMEFSALCSVATFRGVEFAAVLVVSDEICGDSWRPGFSSTKFHKAKESVYTVLQKNMDNL